MSKSSKRQNRRLRKTLMGALIQRAHVERMKSHDLIKQGVPRETRRQIRQDQIDGALRFVAQKLGED
jgi:hypothetical protein